MNPYDALNLLLKVARDAVLVARDNGQCIGLTSSDHQTIEQAGRTIREALTRPTEEASDGPPP